MKYSAEAILKILLDPQFNSSALNGWLMLTLSITFVIDVT